MKYCLVALFATVLSGCVGATRPIHSDVRDQLEPLHSQVTPGQTSRHEVQEKLGQPFISSARWSVEVYRPRAGHDVSVWWSIIPPVPIGRDTEEVFIYALVIYDENDVVQSIDWQVYQDYYGHIPHALGSPGTGGLLDWKTRFAKLQAGGFFFAASKDGSGEQRKEILLAPSAETQNALNTPPPSSMCAVLFFFYGGDDNRTFFLDEERIGELPLLRGYWYWAHNLRVFSKVLVSVGEHELKVTTSTPRDFRRKFLCEPGRIFYVYPEIERAVTRSWWGLRLNYKYEGEIAVRDEPLEAHDSWQRLLFYNGKWLGED